MRVRFEPRVLSSRADPVERVLAGPAEARVGRHVLNS